MDTSNLLQQIHVPLPPTLHLALRYDGPGRFLAVNGTDDTRRQLFDGRVTRAVWMVAWRWWLAHPAVGGPTLPEVVLLDRMTRTVWTGKRELLYGMAEQYPNERTPVTTPTPWALHHALRQMTTWLDHAYTRRLTPAATTALLRGRDDGTMGLRYLARPECRN